MKFTAQHAQDALKALTEDTSIGEMAFILQKYGLCNQKYECIEAHIRKCLNPKAIEFFKFSEVMVLMFETGNHSPFFFLTELLGYELPTKLTNEKRKEILRSRAEELDHEKTMVMAQLEQAESENPVLESELDVSGVFSVEEKT